MKITEAEYNILKEAEEITMVDYNIKWLDAENIEGYINNDDLLDLVKDLVVEYHKKEEELQDHIENCRENHEQRHINYYEEYGISERDFH